jgi:hypothetical protein
MQRYANLIVKRRAVFGQSEQGRHVPSMDAKEIHSRVPPMLRATSRDL